MTYRNLIFLHIPKAAGTTLHRVLERNYSTKNTFTFWENVAQIAKEFPHWPIEERKKIRLLKGHMPFGLHRYLVGDSSYITLLRNPAERVVSHYFYVRRTPRHYLYRTVIEKNISLDEYVASGITEEIDNGQVRLLAGIDRAIPFGTCNASHLETAKRNIAEHFAVAGLSESFDESLALMAIQLGWNWTPYYKNLNITKSKPKARQIDPSTFQTIERDNQLDFELYHWVSTRFQQQLDANRDAISMKIEKLKQANSIYQPLSAAFTRLHGLFRSMQHDE